MNKLVILNLFFILLTQYAFGQNELSKYFERHKLKGSTTVFDYKNQKWIYSDSVDANRKTLPASTFKILNSLIALETQVIKDEKEIFKWDGIEKDFFGVKMDVWNKNTDLKSAYKNSTIWYYVALAEKIGRKNYKHFLKKSHYGNLNFSEQGTDFWNYGNFGISPKNQVEFLINLYKGNLPFSRANLEKVKNMMVSEETDESTFRDKTGWTKKGGQDIGWWVGYVETEDNVFFFATRLIKPIDVENLNFAKSRKEITKEILKELMN